LRGHEPDLADRRRRDEWSVFVFYPADFTFVCPTELEDLADHYDELRKLGVEVYGASTDTHFAHKAWHDTSEAIRKVRYPWVGDPTATLARNFDVLIEEEGLALRGTFVVDRHADDRRGARTSFHEAGRPGTAAEDPRNVVLTSGPKYAKDDMPLRKLG
jgi:alkyl hydroperoxide reductase subunit AhpC